MQRALLLLLGATAGSVENALHDSRAALGDAKPCCGHCERWLYPCPRPCTRARRRRRCPGGLHGAVAAGAEVEIPCGTRVEVRGPQGQDRRAARPRRARVPGRRRRRARDAARLRAVCSRRDGQARESSLESRSPRATTRPSRWTRTVSTTAPRPSRSSGPRLPAGRGVPRRSCLCVAGRGRARPRPRTTWTRLKRRPCRASQNRY